VKTLKAKMKNKEAMKSQLKETLIENQDVIEQLVCMIKAVSALRGKPEANQFVGVAPNVVCLIVWFTFRKDFVGCLEELTKISQLVSSSLTNCQMRDKLRELEDYGYYRNIEVKDLLEKRGLEKCVNGELRGDLAQQLGCILDLEDDSGSEY
jgi:hypothetical protein